MASVLELCLIGILEASHLLQDVLASVAEEICIVGGGQL
jgi:hypothetical protein